MKKGIDLILEERDRQISVMGFTAEKDAQYINNELCRAAAAYESSARYEIQHRMMWMGTVPQSWPWDPSWFKPDGGPVRQLVKAGALYIAAWERRALNIPEGAALVKPDPDVERCAQLIDSIFDKHLGVHLLDARVLVSIDHGPVREVAMTKISPTGTYVHLREYKDGKKRELGWKPSNKVELLEILPSEEAKPE